MKNRIRGGAALSILVVGALVVAGCDSLTDMNNGVASPGTSVDAQFQIVTEGSTVITYLDTPKDVPTGHHNPACLANGVYSWESPVGKPHTTGPNHERCTETQVIPGSTIDVAFYELANFVQPKSGNIHLNFVASWYAEDDDSFPVDQIVDEKRYVHYQKNHNTTEGYGLLYGKDDDGNWWVIDLGQIGHSGNSQIAARKLTGLLAQKVGSSDTYESAELTW